MAALSEPLREFLATLTAVHDGRAAFGKQLKQFGEGSWDGEPYRALEQLTSLISAARQHVERPKIIKHLRIVWARPQHFLKNRHRLFLASEPAQRVAAVQAHARAFAHLAELKPPVLRRGGDGGQ